MLSAFVLPEITQPGEALVAMAALKGPLACMPPQVTLEVIPIARLFLTQWTGMHYGIRRM